MDSTTLDRLTQPPDRKPRLQKRPGLAFFLSLLVPGLGQGYCGKVKRAIITFAFFALALGGIVWSQIPGRESEFLLGWALEVALGLYVFAFLDSYFTAVEINSGLDPHITKSPRVATVLTLLTGWWGYYYLGLKRQAGMLLIVLAIASQLAVKMSEPFNTWLGIVLDLIKSVLAIDAYRIAKNRLREALAHLEPAAKRKGGLRPAVPVGLAILVAVGYVALAAVGFLQPKWLGTSRPATAQERARREFQERLDETPGFKERLTGAKTFDEGKAIGAALAGRGRRRLDDGQLLEHLRLLGVILSLADESMCAQFSRGHMLPESSLTKLDEVSLRSWYDLALAAMRAELQGAPPVRPAPTEDEVSAALKRIGGILPPSDASRFLAILAAGERVSDPDACWAYRTLISALPQSESVHRVTVARFLVSE